MCGNYGNESEEKGCAINNALLSQWISDRMQVYFQEWISLLFFLFFPLRRLEEWSNYLQGTASGSIIYQAWSFKSAANTRQALIKKKDAKMIPHNCCCN